MLLAHTGGGGVETLDELLRSWERAPSIAVLVTLVTVAYVRAWRSTDLQGAGRVLRLAAWSAAMLTIVAALGSPVDALGAHLVSAHMLQHMLLGDLAPALAVVALSGGVGAQMGRTFEILPFPLVARVVRRVPVPVVVAGWALTWGVWHTTWAYELALRSVPVHMLEHGSLFVVGVWLWTAILDPIGRRANDDARPIGAAVAALFFGAILTNSLTYVTEPSYSLLLGSAERLTSWTSTDDQQFAGLVMLGMQSVTIGVTLAWLIRRHLARGSAVRADAASSPQAAQAATLPAAPPHPLGW